jgi:hypothetical protein
MPTGISWFPAAPAGFPHVSTEDDEYKGIAIKRNTMVLPNLWAMQHNERQFPEPLRFNPDRYMRTGSSTEHDSLVDGHYSFGFGRRVCPGRYLAGNSVWVAITRIMWGFDISPELDAQGKPIQVGPWDCNVRRLLWYFDRTFLIIRYNCLDQCCWLVSQVPPFLQRSFANSGIVNHCPSSAGLLLDQRSTLKLFATHMFRLTAER